jgi:hypothetical protein
MSRSRSFAIAALASIALLTGASATAGATTPVGRSAPAASEQAPAPSRAPFLVVALGSLGAGALLLRRAPKLTD